MLVHDVHAIGRNIKFKENVDVRVAVKASEKCCWNCLRAVMTYEGLWCEQDRDEVDFRDLCISWTKGI
jgi:hypothetical protein